MAEAVALLSVAASATVAVAVPVIVSRLERARFGLQLDYGRLEELRSVLDSAAIALAHAESALRTAEEAVEGAQANSSTDEQQQEAQAALAGAARALQQVDEQGSRTAVRLGARAPLLTIYTQAHTALRGDLQILADAAAGGPSSDSVAWRGIVKDLHEVREAYRAHRAAFFEQAAELVGPVKYPAVD